MVFFDIIIQSIMVSILRTLNEFKDITLVLAVRPQASLVAMTTLLRHGLEMRQNWKQFYSIVFNLGQYCADINLIH